jgi:hypothetical protein
MYENLKKHNDNCEYEPMDCSAIKFCKTKGIKKDIVTHTKTCEYVSIDCEHCACKI